MSQTTVTKTASTPSSLPSLVQAAPLSSLFGHLLCPRPPSPGFHCPMSPVESPLAHKLLKRAPAPQDFGHPHRVSQGARHTAPSGPSPGHSWACQASSYREGRAPFSLRPNTQQVRQRSNGGPRVEFCIRLCFEPWLSHWLCDFSGHFLRLSDSVSSCIELKSEHLPYSIAVGTEWAWHTWPPLSLAGFVGAPKPEFWRPS